MDKSPDAFRTISEVADDLDLPQHVLRFWETRFSQIKPLKRGGGRRYYRPDDVMLLRGIRHLLYGEGYTIKGVQRILREQGVRHVMTLWQEGAGLGEQAQPEAPGPDFYAPRPGRGEEPPRAEDRRREPVFPEDDELAAYAPQHARRAAEPELDLDEYDEPEPPLPDEDEEDASHPSPAAAAPATSDVVPLRQPSFAPVVDSRVPTPARDPVELPRDDLGRLKALLSELQDCKRILEAAR